MANLTQSYNSIKIEIVDADVCDLFLFESEATIVLTIELIINLSILVQ